MWLRHSELYTEEASIYRSSFEILPDTFYNIYLENSCKDVIACCAVKRSRAAGAGGAAGLPGGPARFPRSQAIPSLLTRTCKAGLCVQHAGHVLWCRCNLPATRLTLFAFWWDLHSLTSFLSPITSFFCVSPFVSVYCSFMPHTNLSYLYIQFYL